MDELAAAETNARGIPERPFVLLVQPTLFDPRRAPAGGPPWGYCHVPNGSTVDLPRIEAQIDVSPPASATGDRPARDPAGRSEGWNPNLVGGDIAAGRWTCGSLHPPDVRLNPYRTR